MSTDPSTPQDAPQPGKQQPTAPSPGSAAGAPTGPATASAGAPAQRPARGVARTRTAQTWIGLVLGALILIVLLVFVLQNNVSTEFSIFFWDFHLPLGVSMLFAAIAGALIMALVGGARILQLRKEFKKPQQRR